MPEFHLDTSGSVLNGTTGGEPKPIGWGYLDAFTQGYIEALFFTQQNDRGHGAASFSDLAPETLAAILRDCAAYPEVGLMFPEVARTNDGHTFWEMRQAGGFSDFPPLTLYLGGDGKVHVS